MGSESAERKADRITEKEKTEKSQEKKLEEEIQYKPYTEYDLKLFYSLVDIGDMEKYYKEKLGDPGEFPFTRGPYKTMYRDKLWTMRQYAGFGTAKETNERFKFLLAQGNTGLSLAFDLPTQMGYDSDDEIALPEVGKVGVAIDTVEDLSTVFDGIPIDKISVSFTINGTAPQIMAMYLVVAKKRGITWEKLTGTLQNDILKEIIARGTWIYPVEPSVKLSCDVIEFCSKNVQRFNPISVCGYHIREAGATAWQEIAYAFENAKVYVSEVLSRGLDIDSFIKRVTFFFCTYHNLFEEVAKYRAARRMWAHICKELGVKDQKNMAMKFAVAVGGASLTRAEPLLNIARVMLGALATVLGGGQSIFTEAYDEAYSIPSEHSAKIALRTQQILAFETDIPLVSDPLGGSFFIESLTDQIEQRALSEMKRIEAYGGMVKAIKDGFVQSIILSEAYRQQKLVENKLKKIVGVNIFEDKNGDGNQKFEIFRPREAHEKAKLLQEYKKSRDNTKIQKLLDNISFALERNENVMPYLIEAFENGATIGETTKAIKKVYGEFNEPIVV
ncbi:MAG: methylmalonyl-CoA mutase family protein [Candidatus Calescibacterium sp.]|nr:methylmalonyl-CoA mutase family protein [Candidatus Calescibacterium sp.]MDW8087584.1 methylmalonyl-CoA mutase family protein [Candidatus Calescibacterium sp.]